MNVTNISADTIVQNNVIVNGTTDIDNVTVNGNITQTGNKTQTGNYTLAGEFSNSNLYIEDNFITTTESNSDLELRANGTGDILIDTDDTVTISNNLTVGGVLQYNGFLQINGDVTLQGNIQDGNLTITEDFNVTGNLDVTGNAQLEEILIDDNFITTTTSNADLELRANGTGDILFTENTVIPNTMSSPSMDTNNIVNSQIITSNKFSTTDNNITIDDNFITTELSNSNLELRATGNVVSQENTIINQNLTVNGDTDLQDTTITGTITYVGDNNQTGNLNLTGDINLSGNFSITNQPFLFEDILIDGNVLTTTLSNSNLSLESNGTGTVNFDSNVNVTNNLTARDITVTDIVINDEFALENMVSATDVQLFDNVITTSNSNSNLELRAAGTGFVELQNIKFNENVISTTDSTIILNTTNIDIQSNSSLQIPVGDISQRIQRLADEIIDGGDADDILITVYDGGDATTIFGPNDLILDAGVAPVPSGNLGDIRYNSQLGLFEGFSQDLQYFGGVYSANSRTNVSTTTNNTVEFNVNNSLVGTLTSTELSMTGLDVDAISIRNNNIAISGANDLTLSPPGTGITIPNGLKFDNNIILNESATGLVIGQTGFGYTKINSTTGVVTPVGDETNKGATPQQGEIRWNTALEIQEVYNGTEWIAARGIVDNVNASEFEEIIDFWTLVLG
jgi:cytoskeletal protein CcmA (bactofilin family)